MELEMCWFNLDQVSYAMISVSVSLELRDPGTVWSSVSLAVCDHANQEHTSSLQRCSNALKSLQSITVWHNEKIIISAFQYDIMRGRTV